MHEGDDVGVADVLKIGASIIFAKRNGKKPMTHPEDFDLSNEADPCPVVDSAFCQFYSH